MSVYKRGLEAGLFMSVRCKSGMSVKRGLNTVSTKLVEIGRFPCYSLNKIKKMKIRKPKKALALRRFFLKSQSRETFESTPW